MSQLTSFTHLDSFGGNTAVTRQGKMQRLQFESSTIGEFFWHAFRMGQTLVTEDQQKQLRNRCSPPINLVSYIFCFILID
jgi:hypothetical protein